MRLPQEITTPPMAGSRDRKAAPEDFASAILCCLPRHRLNQCPLRRNFLIVDSMHPAFDIILIMAAVLCLVELLFVRRKKVSMTDEAHERYIRWQDYRITQFSFAINLFLTFAVAALGFCLTLVKDSGFTPPIGSGLLLRHSVFSFAGSIVFGSLATLSRLWDFRFTAIKIRKSYDGFRQRAAEFLAKWLGGVSWSLFYLQLAGLAYGTTCLIFLLVPKL